VLGFSPIDQPSARTVVSESIDTLDFPMTGMLLFRWHYMLFFLFQYEEEVQLVPNIPFFSRKRLNVNFNYYICRFSLFIYY
jgi:hypothetical protein